MSPLSRRMIYFILDIVGLDHLNHSSPQPQTLWLLTCVINMWLWQRQIIYWYMFNGQAPVIYKYLIRTSNIYHSVSIYLHNNRNYKN